MPDRIVGALIVVPLLLALSVVVAWKQYDKAEQAVQRQEIYEKYLQETEQIEQYNEWVDLK